MKLSFDGEESFKEAAGLGSLNFINPPSDPNSLLQLGSSSNSMPYREGNEDVAFNNLPSDPNIILEVRRVPKGGISSSGSTPPQEWSEDN